jgi:hypothetical protein
MRLCSPHRIIQSSPYPEPLASLNPKTFTSVAPTPTLTSQQIRHFEEHGFVVLPGVFKRDEIDRAAKTVLRCVTGELALTEGEAYPSPATLYVLRRHHVEEPDLRYFASHPLIVGSVQTLLGSDAELAAAVTYVKTPGAAGTGGDYQGSHPTAHQDYKTYHQAGSSLNSLFAIIPLVDLDERSGPLHVSPGSHKLNQVMEQGRVRRIQRCRGSDIGPLVDTELRRGDLLFMHMWTWHLGGANRSDRDRLGIYNKYRAVNAPPACGPDLFTDKAHAMVTYEGRPLLPHHSDIPLTTARLLIQHRDRFLMILSDNGERGGWHLPGGEPQENDLTRMHDRSNLIDSVEFNVRAQLNLDVPWMTYLADFEQDGGLCRVYAHPLEVDPHLQPAEGIENRWFSAEEICALKSAGKLAGGYEPKAIDLWLDDSYLRGIGQSKIRAAATL